MTNHRRPLATLEPEYLSPTDGTSSLQPGQAPGIDRTLPGYAVASSGELFVPGANSASPILAKGPTPVPLFRGKTRITLPLVSGNAGLPIMIFRRKSASANNNAIRTSTWQVVRIVQGTWLTAVAKYAPTLRWPDGELHRVYYKQWVDRCTLVGGNETKGPYKADSVPEGGRWQDGIGKASGPSGGPRDVNLNPREYWWFKLEEEITIDRPKIAAALAPTKENVLLFGGRTDSVVLERHYRSLEQALYHPFQTESDAARARFKAKVGGIQQILNEARTSTAISTKKIELLKKAIQRTEALVRSRKGNAEAAAMIKSFYGSAIKNAEQKHELAENVIKVLETELELIDFIFETYDIHHGQTFEVVKVQKGTNEELKWNGKIPQIKITTGPEW